MGLTEGFYARLPVWGQHLAVSAYGAYWHWVRFGPGYREAVAGFRSREAWAPDRWRAWTDRRLRNVLAMAARSVPYYRDTWSPGERSAAARGRLSELPLLDKEPLRADASAFLRDDMTVWRPLKHDTSGSTGTPVRTYWTVEEYRGNLAVREARSANWAGVSFTDPRATFSGRIVVPDPESKGPFHRFNMIERQVYFSAFHLGPGTARAYVDALRRNGTRWITGYAVSCYLLARYMVEQGLSTPSVEAVVTTSEKVTPAMRQVMEEGFGCPVFEEYGTVENIVFASECGDGRLHVSPDVSVVEILDRDGRPCEPGEVGEVVATSLSRLYQPFVRFRLGDLASWDPEPCPCGRSLPVLQDVVGRIEDVLVGPDGREMVRFHGVFVDQPHIREGQVIQEELDRIRVKVVPAEGFTSDDEAGVVSRIRQRMGDVRVEVEVVDEIPRAPSGKFVAVVSRLKDRGEATS